MQALSPCPVCGTSTAEALSPPHPFRSVTSGGTILKAPLRKAQCLSCGLGRQGAKVIEDKIAFYRDQYGQYHKRPGTTQTELARYDSMARWIFEELGDFSPGSVLDVGCGGGLLLDALRRAKPGLSCAGIDPSSENSESARALEMTVVTGSVPGSESYFEAAADLVLTANVISHVLDPIGFLAAMASTIHSSGRVVIYGHNGDAAGADLLWADIDFSFCREHLISIAAKVGLEHVNKDMQQPPAGQEDKYVLVFRKSAEARPVFLSEARRDEIIADRRQYFEAWRLLAERLSAIDTTSRQVINFGASFWSIALAGYCPDYWGRVSACAVDQEAGGSFFGKPIIPTSQIPSGGGRPVIVLGTNPSTHAKLVERLSEVGDVISWNDLIQR